MFFEDFVAVQRSVVIANAWLLAHADEVSRVAAPGPGPVVVGPPRERHDGLVLPFTWAKHSGGAFSDLDADILTAGLNDSTTHLGLVGTCAIHVTPPGRRSQERAAELMAEHAIREFLAGLAETIETAAGEEPD